MGKTTAKSYSMTMTAVMRIQYFSLIRFQEYTLVCTCAAIF